MKFDACEFEKFLPAYDVCIVGSGPSGLVTALQLKSRGLRICVLESGNFQPESHAIGRLKAVESDGIVIRSSSRVRIFGGTSTSWSGFVAPLDPIDFAPRAGIHNGWPIRSHDVQAHLDKHGYRYGLPPSQAFNADVVSIAGAFSLSSGPVVPKVFRTQVPVFDFGKSFSYTFLEEGFDLIVNATVARLKTSEAPGETRIDTAVFYDGNGNDHYLSARIFVIAASAIESVRILWNSDQLGNAHDQLGRYFMNHPKGDVAQVAFRNAIKPDHPFLKNCYLHFDGYIGLRLSEKVQHESGFLNSYIRLEPLRDVGRFPRAKELSRAFRATVKSIRALDGRATRSSLSHLILTSTGVGELIRRGWFRAVRKRSSKIDAARIRCFVEMEPNFEHRVSVGTTVDDNGMPLAKVAHTPSALALGSVDHLLTKVSEEFLEQGLGQITRSRLPLAEILSDDASHHLGGARMGVEPQTSVVDTSLRLHDVSNLYVAGGAVFPTGGNANPTMTMIGLAIRLSEKIATEVEARPPSANSRTGAAVIVIGAGKRVAEDIIPAIETLEPIAYVDSVFATSRKSVFGPKSVHDVEPFKKLTGDKIANAQVVYVAIPPKQLATVLKQLLQHNCSHLTLVIDTPAQPLQVFDCAYSRFRNVVVAEDAAFLPWIDLIVRKGSVAEIVIDRSGYQYHAAAMAKALAGNPRPHIQSTRGRKRNIQLSFDTGVRTRIFGPRDYEVGILSVRMTDGTEFSSHPGPTVLQIEPIIDGHFCIGFRLGTETSPLCKAESRLLGRFLPSDTIVSRMLDIKRVGLYRLLKLVIEDKPAYTLEEALDDNRPKW